MLHHLTMWQTVFKPNSFKWYIKMKIFGFFATFLSLAQVCPQHSSKTKIDFVGNRGPGFPDHRTRSKSNWSGIQSANRSNFGPVVRALDTRHPYIRLKFKQIQGAYDDNYRFGVYRKRNEMASRPAFGQVNWPQWNPLLQNYFKLKNMFGGTDDYSAWDIIYF